MTQEKKAREFWIDNRDETLENFFLYNVKRGVMNYNFEGAIHAIEYSAYEAEREKVRRLVDSLRKLNNEVAAMVATHGDIIAQDYGRTNLECLEFRLNGSRALLKEIEEA